MYAHDDVRFIFFIINEYLNKKINENQFCDEFRASYDLEIDLYALEVKVYEALHELGEVAGRFSEFESDHKKYPGLYYTKEELAAKILETKQKLMKIHPEYFEC